MQSKRVPVIFLSKSMQAADINKIAYLRCFLLSTMQADFVYHDFSFLLYEKIKIKISKIYCVLTV